MRCHYEVLGVEMSADLDDLKKVYRKLALQYHPDKNLDNIEEATQKFREVQQAYDVLSDPQERAWYDRHRDAILRGGLGENYEDKSLDVFQYFNSSCYRGYNDESEGFYTIYRKVFELIGIEDLEFVDDKDKHELPPSFGTSDSSYDEVVHEFYAFWQSYCTCKSYSWMEKYDIREGENRRIVRLMEKENKKLRDQGKKKRNDEVRALVAFVRKRDKRVQLNKKKLEEKAAENAKKVEENRRRQLEERKKQLETYKETEWASMSSLSKELEQLEVNVSSHFGDVSNHENVDDDVGSDESEELDYETFYCVACDKHFKTEKAFANHENSKKHRESVVLLKEIMKEEDCMFNLQGTNEDTSKIEVDDESLHEIEIEMPNPRKKKQKKKNGIVIAPVESDHEDIHAELIEVVNEDKEPKENTTQSSSQTKGKKAKEAKKKAKLKPVDTPVVDEESSNRRCDVCGTEFSTRNKLFSHLSSTGHSVAKQPAPAKSKSRRKANS